MECCQSKSDLSYLESMKKCMFMSKCMKMCRWCPVMLIAFGIILFLVGYFLSPEIVRILWLFSSVLWVLMGVGCLVMMQVVCRGMDLAKEMEKEEKEKKES